MRTRPPGNGSIWLRAAWAGLTWGQTDSHFSNRKALEAGLEKSRKKKYPPIAGCLLLTPPQPPLMFCLGGKTCQGLLFACGLSLSFLLWAPLWPFGLFLPADLTAAAALSERKRACDAMCWLSVD